MQEIEGPLLSFPEGVGALGRRLGVPPAEMLERSNDDTVHRAAFDAEALLLRAIAQRATCARHQSTLGAISVPV
jgi:hypothetical protein